MTETENCQILLRTKFDFSELASFVQKTRQDGHDSSFGEDHILQDQCASPCANANKSKTNQERTRSCRNVRFDRLDYVQRSLSFY